MPEIIYEDYLDKKICILRKTTLIDFPGRVSSAIFFRNCNLRCPYCYNHELVLSKDISDLVTLKDVLAHLTKRKNVLSGLVISGGEALLFDKLPDFIRLVKQMDYLVKLDTNGLLPVKLAKIIENPDTKPNFISMDIKTSLSRYSELNPNCNNHEKYSEKILESINLLKKLSIDNYEFRTVLVPTLITQDDIKNIASVLPQNANWMFSNFRNDNCLNPEYNNILPYSDKEINNLVDFAQNLIPNSKLR